MDARVNEYIETAERWRDELQALRRILLDCGLDEDWKWRAPCYTFHGSNIVIVQAFKQYFALMFFRGALLSDPHGILVKAGENTRASRQLRFTDAAEIMRMNSVVKDYVLEAIEVEKAGVKPERQAPVKQAIPAEFQTALDADPALQAAFDALTPGRRRAYLMYFSGAKQSATRTSRVEKCVPRILDGKGLSDR
jgi:uncharacterized protein YdeI (YjbR/CyaY-like superfamily)